MSMRSWRRMRVKIIVLDNFVRGTRANLNAAVLDRRVSVVDGSILDRDLLRDVMTGTDYVFHLAHFGSMNV